ncbi:hypothetical protein [Spirillospora sp. NPDC047279]|uniref:hypothetical protein n=1 Tax=Spirillospora sp. NPDC047279 TaxID=3155478 RepID=UPI0033FBE502
MADVPAPPKVLRLAAINMYAHWSAVGLVGLGGLVVSTVVTYDLRETGFVIFGYVYLLLCVAVILVSLAGIRLARTMPRRRTRTWIGALLLESCLAFGSVCYALVTLLHLHWATIIFLPFVISSLLAVAFLLSGPTRTFFRKH